MTGNRARLPFYDATRIDTPMKRAGYVVFWAALVLILGTLLAFGFLKFRPGGWGNVFYGLFVGWPSESFSDFFRYGDRPYRRLACGLALAILGYLASYGFDRFVAPFLRWLKRGQ